MRIFSEFIHRNGGAGAKTQSQSDSLSWGVSPQQQAPGTGDTGKAGQGEQGQGSR